MDPKSLVDLTFAPEVPAPFWFVQLFKVIGFTLHQVPMNLWYAGVVLSMILYVAGSQQGKQFATRLMLQMPVVIAYGINFGIVPLLFIQVAYAKAFYPATILMAWFWFAVIVLLNFAYYGVYIFAFGLRDPQRTMKPWKLAAGWIAALGFLAIGFIFANALSLTTNVAGWPDTWLRHSVAGATWGTGMNHSDATLWPRWLLMFGLALMTTGAWAIVDAGWFASQESQEYKGWVGGFALKLYSAGLLWFALAGSWYVFGTWRPDVRDVMFQWPWIVMTAAAAVSPGIAWILIFFAWMGDRPIGRGIASLVGLAQFGVLGANAIARQTVQNFELSPYLNVAALPTDIQWSPLLAFLVLFIAGLGLIAWMVAQILHAPPEPT